MSAQLAAFKVPFIENEPMVDIFGLPILTLCHMNDSAESLRTGLTRACSVAGRNLADGAGASL
jgi:hypothetical protein